MTFGGAADELVEDREPLVQRWVLLEVALDDPVDSLLDHHVDQVLLIALEDDGEEEQACCLLVRH